MPAAAEQVQSGCSPMLPQCAFTNGRRHMLTYAVTLSTVVAVATAKYRKAGSARLPAVAAVPDSGVAHSVTKDSAETATPATAWPASTPCA